MRLKISLGVTAAAVALALAPPAAQALTPAQAGATFTYSAQTMAANGDSVALPALSYVNTEFMPNGTTIVFTPSPGTTFTNFNANTYSSVPFTAASGPAFPPPPVAQPTETANSGICNGNGNATTTAITATSITCTINAGTFSFSNVGAPGTPPAGTSTNASVVFGVFAGSPVILRGVNNTSPFSLSGLAALDNPLTLQGLTAVGAALGATSLPTASILAQAGAGGNGVTNGVVPNASSATTPGPLGNANGVGIGTTLATTNPAIGDPNPVPVWVIRSANMVTPILGGATLRIDLSNNGLANKFVNTSQPNGVSTAGLLGRLGLNEVNGLLDAATGLNINSQASNFSSVGGPRLFTGVVPSSAPGQNVQTTPADQPNCNSTTNAVVNCGSPTVNNRQSTSFIENLIQGGANVTISGNFPTIVNAFAVAGGQADSCTPSLSGGGNVVAVSAPITSTSIQFNLPVPGTQAAAALTLPSGPLTNAGSNSNVEYAICLINGSGVIQPTAQAMTAPANQLSNLNGITISVSLAVNNGTAFPLVAANQAFGTIQFDGAAYYFENVFGAANSYPSFFRVINQGATPATVLAIVTKDALTPGSNSTVAAGGTSLFGTAAGTAPAGAPAAPIAILAPNDATYITADQVAAAVGQTLAGGTGKATVWLISKQSAFRASMVAQSIATGDLINLQ